MIVRKTSLFPSMTTLLVICLQWWKR